MSQSHTCGPSASAPADRVVAEVAVTVDQWRSKHLVMSGVGVLTIAFFLAGIFFLPPLSRLDLPPLFTDATLPTSTPTSIPTVSVPESTPALLDEETSILLLHETFADSKVSSLDAGTNDYASFAFVDEAYRITVQESDAFVWSPCEGTFTDVTIATELIFTAGSEDTAAGILFRFQDEHNFYFFSISANGYYALDLLQNGRWESLVDWTRTAQVKPSGEPNQLRVEVVEDYIRLYSNDVLLDVISDDTFDDGKVALAVNTFEKSNVTIFFDNLFIWRDAL